MLLLPGLSVPNDRRFNRRAKAAILNLIAMKRHGEVEEIAELVSFLASPGASYITGQVIEISGGLSM